MPGLANPLDRSILIDVRSACNIDEGDNGFDNKLIPLINSQFMMAHQFGIGYEGFYITGSQQTWRDWLGDNGDKLTAATTWLGYSVLLMFNPPENSTVSQMYKDQINKAEWMLCSKSQQEGFVRDYAPSSIPYYDSISAAIADED